MSNTRKVEVFHKAHPILAYDGKMNKTVIGEVVTRQYQGEETFRHDYMGVHDEPKVMKPTKNNWAPLNHVDVIDPFLDMGWEIKNSSITRGGLMQSTVMVNPDKPKFYDPFTYDDGVWGDQSGQDDGIAESIFIKNSLRSGGGVFIQRGFYRFICANGLVDSVLDLGKIRMKFDTWDINELVTELFQLDLTPEVIRGPVIGSRAGLMSYADFLFKFLDREESARYINTLLPVVQNMTRPVEKFPRWAMSIAAEQFNELVKSKVKDVHRGDVLNVLTNSVSLGLREDENRSVATAERKLQSTLNASSDLISIFSMTS